MLKPSGQNLYVAAILASVCALVGYVSLQHGWHTPLEAQVGGARRLDQIPFDGASAYKYLTQLCDLGPRLSGSPGMKQQQELLVAHFEKLGATVERQAFEVRHPLDGSAVKLTNLIVHWHPQRNVRMLLCAHYDTRPLPDQDPVNRQGRFVGANDGASGVAILMELGKSMPRLAGSVGVDFVLFDGEELIYRETDKFFLGSEHFAREYIRIPPAYRYRAGVLMDMVGDTDLQLYLEPNSLRYARSVTADLWAVARRLKVREFVTQPMQRAVSDDHIPLNEIARIPTCDIIDFTYPYWHTEGDTPAHCSALSLAKVGWVVYEWLKDAVK
jgi:glutaminyl-peptide cyclotransferase